MALTPSTRGATGKKHEAAAPKSHVTAFRTTCRRSRSFRVVGNVLIAISGALVYKYVNTQIVLLGCVIYGGLAAFLTTILPSLMYLHVVTFFIGCTMGFMEIGEAFRLRVASFHSSRNMISSSLVSHSLPIDAVLELSFSIQAYMFGYRFCGKNVADRFSIS